MSPLFPDLAVFKFARFELDASPNSGGEDGGGTPGRARGERTTERPYYEEEVRACCLEEEKQKKKKKKRERDAQCNTARCTERGFQREKLGTGQGERQGG